MRKIEKDLGAANLSSKAAADAASKAAANVASKAAANVASATAGSAAHNNANASPLLKGKGEPDYSLIDNVTAANKKG